MKNFFYRFVPAIVIVLVFPLMSSAFQADVIPAKVNPGDVFLIKLSGNTGKPPQAEFREHQFSFYRLNDAYIALVPVDISTPPKKYNIKINSGDEAKTVIVTVNKHTFRTIKLTLPKEKVFLSPDDQARATKEAELLNRIWPVRNERIFDSGFIAPTDTEISEVFGVKRIMNEKKTSVHRGMDFRGKSGTPVKAINAGKVVLTDDHFYGGNTLIVDHGMGLYSVYMHLSEFKALKDEQVRKGQLIGLIGNSGRATGPHLHMSVKLNGVSVNPEALFKLKLL